jgi:hypothetical protein
MKYWVKLSRSIFKLAALPFIRKIKPKSIESVLRDSLHLLTAETADEIRNFILRKQTPGGGFADRAGNGDLYYSLFGYFIAEAYSVNKVKESLKGFVKKEIETKNLSGAHLYCASILYSKLFDFDDTALALGKKIKQELKSSLHSSTTSTLQNINPPEHQPSSTSVHLNYSSFMEFLALYYLEDFLALKNLLNQYRILSSSQPPIDPSTHQHITPSAQQLISSSAPQPCPVTAANAILRELSNHPNLLSAEKIRSFHQPSGGFRAVTNAPCEDLLSTGVALYALKFIDTDIRLLKPNCLSFVDDLYENGGFRATQSDFETDIEYTFYGLLALGALK